MIKDTDKTIGLARYRQRGDLTGRKLKEYLPTMLVINLSTLVLGSVNGIVAGNLVSSNALSSVNLFFPVLVVVASVSTLTAVGIATSLSTAMGRNDVAAIDHIKGAALRIMLVMAIAAGILQIPVVWLVVRSYGPSWCWRLSRARQIFFSTCFIRACFTWGSRASATGRPPPT